MLKWLVIIFNYLLFICIFQFSVDDSAQVEVDADYRFGIEIPEGSSANYPTPVGSVQGDNNVKIQYKFTYIDLLF